jgi:GNAT superfamily N-acetyltransferase
MKSTHRNYSEALGDFGRLARFVVKNNQAVRRYSTWCLGRVVDWRTMVFDHKQPITSFCETNCHLWFDSFGELAAFAISENGDAEFALITAAGYRFLFAEMLSWALENWAGRGPHFSVEITAHQEMEAGLLERAGFRQRAAFSCHTYDLAQALPAPYPLAAGFTIVDMASHPDYRAQRVMRAEAFSGRANLSAEEIDRWLAWQAEYHQGPIYHPPTDLCVMAPDGAFVAGCEALIDAWNAEADIERVCTHSAYRRRGFARAVIQECLFRLKEMGLRRVAITGYDPGAIALYASFGVAEEARFYIYATAGPGAGVAGA